MERGKSGRSLSGRVSAASLAAEREILDSWIPADSTRPVYSAIRNAFIEHFSLLYLVLVEKAQIARVLSPHSVQEVRPPTGAIAQRLHNAGWILPAVLFGLACVV